MKASFEVSMKSFCTGCGIQRVVRMILEPIALRNAYVVTEMIQSAVTEMESAPCPECKTKTKMINWTETSPIMGG